MIKLKYIFLFVLTYIGYLFYNAEEHFEHLVSVIKDEEVG